MQRAPPTPTPATPNLFHHAWSRPSHPALPPMYFAPRPTSPPAPVPKGFRLVQPDQGAHSKSAWASDTKSNGAARTRTSSIVSVTRHTGKGKEKETTDSIASSSFTDPWSVERTRSTSTRLGSTHSSSRPNSADPSAPRRHGSILGAASDALRFGRRRKSLKQQPPIRQEILTEVIEISAPKPDEEEEERQRLRDAAARSVGLGIDLLEPARSRDDSLYEEDEDEDEQVQYARSRDDIRSMDSFTTDALSPNRAMRESAPVVLPAHPFANRRRAGSLALSITRTPSRVTSQSPSPTVPAFPATHSSLTPFTHLSATLPKYYPPPSLFMMALSKQWRTRFVVLTTPSQSSRLRRASLGPTVSYLHIFKSSGNEERELERLEINENSVVFVTDEEIGGRRNVVKVGGVDVGAMKKELNAEETGLTMMLLQIVDNGESRKWINAIKSNILGQRSIRAGLGLPSNSLGGAEPRGDMDVMLSMRMQGMVSPSVPGSPLAPDFGVPPALNGNHFEDLDMSTKSPTSTVRSQTTPQRSPKAVTALKGLFTGSGRSRSSSRAASPEPDDDFPGDSFGSVASSMMAMPKTNGAAMSISERARSPISSSPIMKPLSLLSPTTSPVLPQETQLERRIVESQTNMDWAVSGPPSPTIATPTRAMSPSSLMPPPPRRRAWTTNEAPPVKRESPGLLIYNHGNASTAGSFGVALSNEVQSSISSARPSTEYSGSGSHGTPVQKGRGSSVSSVSTYASGERENMGLDRSNSTNRRWSRQLPISKRSSPSSGSPPSQPWQSGPAYSQRLSHPYAAERLSSDRPSSQASSSNQSHKSPPSLGSNLQKFSKRTSVSSSIYSVSTTNSSPPPKSNRLSVPRMGNNKRLSLPPPQRPAPVMALPPTPASPAESSSSSKRPGSAPATKTSFRDSFAQRAMRLSLLPPTNPPSHSLPPRPDELDARSHNRASSIDSKAPSESLYTIPSTPTDSPNPPSMDLHPHPPAPTPASPRLAAAFKQRLRILSAPSAPPPMSTPPAAPTATFDLEIAAAQASLPSTPIGERITHMQNDPSFLLQAGPTQPMAIPPPQLPPRSPFRPPPPERSPENHEMTSLSPPPPRRGSRHIATPDREKTRTEVEATMSLPEDASVELGERKQQPPPPVDLSRNASTLSLGILGVS